MGRPRATKANALGAILALLLGFAMATQVRQNEAQGLDTLSQADLVTLLDSATLQSQRLDQQARQLQITHDQLVNGTTSGAAAVQAAQERVDSLAILAGSAAAKGPGIQMTITDPTGKLTAPVLLNAIEELRDAGAEAIQVNNVRIVASSHFSQAASGFDIDGKNVSQPYVILAIGNAQTMSSAMQIPGGLTENVQQLGALVNITLEKELTVAALHVLSSPRYALPVPPSATPTP